jgi:hypothetical protein
LHAFFIFIFESLVRRALCYLAAMRKLCLGLFFCIALAMVDSRGDDNPTNSKGFGGFLKSIFGRQKTEVTNATSVPATNVSGDSIISSPPPARNKSEVDSTEAQAGLKEALETGFTTAINLLGKTNGFLTNAAVRIPMPPQLNYVEQALRKVHQDALVDSFEATMNHAAEKAVPAAADVLLGAIKQMTVQDALGLLSANSQTAITDYFRKTASTNLFSRLMPIIQEATSSTGVTAEYKNLMSKIPPSLSFLSQGSVNLDQYVTGKTLDGLFKVAADEEKRIRENPRARTTELLQKVFGAFTSPNR